MAVKVRKAHNLLWACRRAYGATCGLKPNAVHWLYFSIIRPSITTASLVWLPGCTKTSATNRLSRVQTLASLGAMGAMEALTCPPPPPTGDGSSECGEVSCASSLESGMLVLPSPPSRTQQQADAASAY